MVTERSNGMNYWIYVFADGNRYELIGSGFSAADVIKLEEIHGKCIDHIVEVRWR